MFRFLIYLYSLFRLEWILYRKKHLNRFDNYSPDVDLTRDELTGLVANKDDWFNSTPNLNRNENVLLVASNAFNKSGLFLSIKWRPHSEFKIATLLTRLSLEVGDDYLDYDDTKTYSPTKCQVKRNYVTQYGSNGSCLKLKVIRPYARYRLLFRGYMRVRNSIEEQRYVRLNLLVFQTSKVFDFKEQFDAASLARQYAAKLPKCGLTAALDNLVLHDRHELTSKLIGDYSIQAGNEKRVGELHLWGFHSRQFVVREDQERRSKRMLGHLTNGRAFHLGIRENVASNFDINEQLEFGYACFDIGPAVEPTSHSDKPLNWTRLTSNTAEVEFLVRSKDHTFTVEARKRSSRSLFMDMTLGATDGWGVVLINDSLDLAQETHAVEVSLRGYQEAVKSCKIVDSNLYLEREFSEKPLAISIEDFECQYTCLVGSKASSLAQLKALATNNSGESSVGYQVPPAVMLTRHAYEALQELNPTLRDEIRTLEAASGQNNKEDIIRACERLQRVIQFELKLPPAVRKELAEQMVSQLSIKQLESLDNRSFAVRSSSWGEDEDDMSAAGQLETVLSVQNFEDLSRAVMRCFASKFSHTNIEYKRQRGLPLDLPMAVVVQEMIDCEKAGVLFTCDPTTGNTGHMTMTANFGLGESVVSGRTDPDTIRIRIDQSWPTQEVRQLHIEEVQIGEKKVIFNSESVNSPPDNLASDQYDRSRCCLSEEEILSLARCGLDLAGYFGCPRDIEWGYKDSQLYLFQSRPVTGLDAYTEFELMHEADAPSRAELEFSTRANVGEVMPYAATPLQLSYFIKIWTVLTNNLFRRLGKIRPEDYTLNYDCDFTINSYHTFFTLRGSALFNFTRKDKKRPLSSRALEVGIFGHEVDDEELIDKASEMAGKSHRIKFEELRFALVTWKYRFMPDKLIASARQLNSRLRRDVHSLRYTKRGDLSDLEGLLGQLKVAFGFGKIPGTAHITSTLISSKANFRLLELLSKYYNDSSKLHSAFSKFLASSPNVLSAEIPHRVDKMARLIQSRGQKDVQDFVAMSPTEALKYVSRDAKEELSKEFDAFMVKFGHRCYNEFEVSAISWRDSPEKIVEMLQTNLRKYMNGAPADEGGLCKEKMRVDEIIETLDVKISFIDKLRLKYLIAPVCQKFVSMREQTKDLMIEHTDITRDASRLLARALRQQNRIPEEDLFYYMFYHELEDLIREPQPQLVVQATKRRKLFAKHYQSEWRFDEIVRGHEIVPAHLRPSKELDAKVKNAPKLHGTTACSGRVQAKVCLVNSFEEIGKVQSGDILLAYSTDIAFSPIFPLLSGVITEVGGLISHGAVVAREYGLPSVIGIKDVTKILKHGEEIILDADNSTIIRLSQS